LSSINERGEKKKQKKKKKKKKEMVYSQGNQQ
jgi:hypothetical protein